MSVHETWLKYNECANNLKELLGGANTNVGGYAEYLCARHYGGEILGNSHPSADIKTPNGTLYQVKARKITGTKSTQLSVIRSWDFDYLIVILFDKKGGIQCAIEMSADRKKLRQRKLSSKWLGNYNHSEISQRG